MVVLLTGATGFVGDYVLSALQQQGIETVVLGRRRPEAPVSFVEADLLNGPDFSQLMQQIKPTHLLHLAWYAEHGQYWTSQLNLHWVEATTRLVEAFCEHGGEQVVVAGTCAEYDWQYGYCREESTPLTPATLYGVAKDAARRLAMGVCARFQIPCAWGRIFLPYGPGEASVRLIPALIEVFQGKRAAFGVNGSAYRDFLHVSDVADGFVVLLRKNANGAYNISSGQAVQLAEVVREIAHLCDGDPQEVLDLSTERLGEPLLLVGENLKLKALGWEPRIALIDGLVGYIRYSGKDEERSCA